MSKQTPTLNQADIELLTKHFVTKDELKVFRKEVNKKLDKISKDLTTTIEFFDKDIVNLDRRVSRVENHLNLSQS